MCRRFLSDNDSAYRAKPWGQACEGLALTAKRTRTYIQRSNGKAERVTKTLLNDWA